MNHLPSITKEPLKSLALACVVVTTCMNLGTFYFQTHSIITTIISIFAVIVSIGAYFAIDRGYKAEATSALAWYSLLAILSLAYCNGGINSTAIFFLPIGAIILGLYSKPRHAIAYGLVAAIGMLGLWAIDQFEIATIPPNTNPSAFILGAVISGLFLVIAGIYISAKERSYTTQRLNDALTDLSKRNTAISASEARFQRVLNLLGDSIFVLDGAGYVRRANGHALRTLGYTQDEVENTHCTQFCAEFNMQSVLDWFARVEEGASLTVISDLCHKNGRLITCETRLTHFTSVVGESVVLCVSRDITDRQQKEKLLLETQKTQSMGLIAGGIAHDFNNVLVPILGQTSTALRKLEPTHTARGHLLKSMRAAKDARKLVEQLLAYAGKRELEKEIADVNALMAQNIELFNLGIPGNISLRTALTPELPAIKVDTTQFQQVMLNLIINASEAMHDKRGKIDIATAPLTLCKKRTVGTAPLSAGDYVQIKVTDSGTGMDESTISRLFEPFYTTKADGHGLGLAAVDGIVRGHHGSINVTSELGKGSCFEILLPVEHQPPVVKPFRI